MTEQETRIERDSFGPIEVPADRLWGAQTQRSLEFFDISTEKMPAPLIRALAIVKRSSARVNAELGTLSREKADAIVPRPTKCSPACTAPSFLSRSGRRAPARRPT
jgi:fumarate hydratase class II